MNKEDMMFSAIRKKDILPLVTVWMKPEGILLSKIRWTEEVKYCVISFIYDFIHI